MAVKTTNNAAGTLAASITVTATTIVLTSGQGARFPNPTAPDWFPVTLFNAGGTIEILRCTARSGDSLTVVRGQEGTAAFAFSAGDGVSCRITSAALANKLDMDTGGTIAGALTVTGGITGALTGTASTASALATGQTISLTGDITATTGAFNGTSSVTGAASLATTGVTAGSYTYASITVDAKGRVTAASSGTVPAASTSTAGLVALATGAQVIAGTDTTHAVTPASLASQQSLAAHGYYTLPGGLMLQWMEVTVAGQTATTATFPTGFPTACFGVMATCTIAQGATGGRDATYGWSTNGFSIYNEAASTQTFQIFAFGN